MLMPSIFGENLFDDWMDFPFEREFFGRRNPLYGKNEKNLMKTDVKEVENGYEVAMDLPGFKKEDISAKLENGYLAEIGEPLLTEESTERLRAAVEQGHIRFLLAYRGCRAVGMCSVAENFSTFCCGPVAVLEDLYVEPVFRRQGIARQLTRSAQALCRERGVGSLTVCCAPCDEAMYQALGFNVPLGVSRSCLL